MEKLQPKCEKGYSHWSNCKLIKKDVNYLCSKCPFTSCHKCNSFISEGTTCKKNFNPMMWKCTHFTKKRGTKSCPTQ